jgi:CheY-like chemotaxis protein
MTNTIRMEPADGAPGGWTDRIGEIMHDETLSDRERLLMVEALFAHDSAASEVARAAEPGRPTAAEPSRTVLVVDDEPAIREVLRRQLGAAGYVVLEAENGREALRIIEQPGAAVGLVLSDVAMPGMNGLELAARVLAGHPEKRVVLMSADPPIGFAPVAAGMATVRLIRKPTDPENLVRTLRAAVAAPTPPLRCRDDAPRSAALLAAATTPP